MFAPYCMSSNSKFKYRISLSQANEIMVAQDGQKVDGYTFENIKLEYSTIQSPSLYNQIQNEFQLKSLIFEDVNYLQPDNWGKDTTIINKKINLACQSMRNIVMFFKKGTLADSEECVFPKITRVDVTIDGFPNAVYSQGLRVSRLFAEARYVFFNHDTDTLSITDFF